MTDVADTPDPLGMLRGVLDLRSSGARTREDIFVGSSHPMPGGRVFGGQVLGQAVMASSATVPPDRAPHSLHGYFLRPGDATADITLAVDRIHDGRSFSRRRIQAFQDGEPIFSGIASFQDDDPGVEHQLPMPDAPAPEELPDSAEVLKGAATELHPRQVQLLRSNPIEIRPVEPSIRFTRPSEPSPRQMVWTRVRGDLGEDPAIHRAALAYLSDFTIQEPVLRAAGLSWAEHGMKSASLDHAIWWHRFTRADQWMLYVQESPGARGGRGLGIGRLYARAGVHVATVTQEIMVRIPAHA